MKKGKWSSSVIRPFPPFSTRRVEVSARKRLRNIMRTVRLPSKQHVAATLNGGVQRDIYYAKARGYKSALESSLFQDNVPIAVYDNLIKSVHVAASVTICFASTIFAGER